MISLPNPFSQFATPEPASHPLAAPATSAAEACNPSAAASSPPEPFSDFARKRSMAIVSPPAKPVDIDSIALGAVSGALGLHPRDLDFDPPPIFLRSPVFQPEHTHGIVSTLLKLAGVAR